MKSSEFITEADFSKDPSGLYRNMHTGVLVNKPGENLGEPSNAHKADYYRKELERLKLSPTPRKTHIAHAERMVKKFSESIVDEAYALKKRVKIVGKPAPLAWIGKYGWIGEIRHGLHNKSPKMYTVDLDHGGGSIMLPKEALRLVKEPVTEFADEVNLNVGSIAHHHLIGNVKILKIKGPHAEVVEPKSGKHFSVQMSSLEMEEVDEGWKEKAGAAAAAAVIAAVPVGINYANKANAGKYAEQPISQSQKPIKPLNYSNNPYDNDVVPDVNDPTMNRFNLRNIK
jgi:hypothetical protein